MKDIYVNASARMEDMWMFQCFESFNCSMLSINITDALFVGIRVAVIAKKESITCFNCLIYNYYQINFNYITIIIHWMSNNWLLLTQYFVNH